jgi:hypothetical protein
MGIVRLGLLGSTATMVAAAVACNALTGVGALEEAPCVADCGSATNPEIDAGAVDASVADTTRRTDAGADTNPSDTGTGPDRYVPPGDDWCASQDAGFRLCSDFDLPDAAVTQGFDLGVVPVPFGAGGSFQLNSMVSVSPPFSALGIGNPFDAGTTSGDRLEGTLSPLGATPTTIRCAVEWMPVHVSTVAGDYAHIFSITVFTDAAEANQVANFSVQMHGDGSLIFLEDYPPSIAMEVPHTIPAQVGTGTWYAVQIVLATSSGTAAYAASVGGVQTGAGMLAVPLPATSHLTLSVGPAYFAGATTTASPGWTFGYDNVICY